METAISAIDGYAAALLDIFRAEGDADRLTDEFFSVAQALDGNAELRAVLTDPQLPVERKHGIVDELLGARADRVTVAAVNLLDTRAAEASSERVEAKVIVDPSVVGGVVAKIGDTVFDGSVKSRLDALREQWG